MYTQFYPENPLPSLESRAIGMAGLAEKHAGMTFSHDEEQYENVGMKIYPEDKEMKNARVRKNYQR